MSTIVKDLNTLIIKRFSFVYSLHMAVICAILVLLGYLIITLEFLGKERILSGKFLLWCIIVLFIIFFIIFTKIFITILDKKLDKLTVKKVGIFGVSSETHKIKEIVSIKILYPNSGGVEIPIFLTPSSIFFELNNGDKIYIFGYRESWRLPFSRKDEVVAEKLSNFLGVPFERIYPQYV